MKSTPAATALAAAAVIGLAACVSGNSGGGDLSGSATTRAAWAAACAQTAHNTFTVSDENANQATVTDCGYEVGNTANGMQAAPGKVFVSTVFRLAANQAASFDPNNGTYERLYTGNRTDCTAAANSARCPSMSSGGDAYAMKASGEVDPSMSAGHATLLPLFRDAPQYQVVTTQVAQPASTHNIVVVHHNGAASTGNFSTFMISSRRQHLPIRWGPPR